MASKWLATAAMAVGLAAMPSLAAAEPNFRVFAGVSDVEDIEYSYYGYDIDFSTDSGFVVGAAVGVDVGNWLLEGELAYRSADLNEVSAFGYSYDVDGDLSSTSLMANVWYNIPTGGNWGIYVGGGAGVAQVEVEADDPYYGYDVSEDGTELIWQLGAGVNLRTDSGFSYGLGYRYVSIPEVGETEINAHEVVFEVQF